MNFNAALSIGDFKISARDNSNHNTYNENRYYKHRQQHQRHNEMAYWSKNQYNHKTYTPISDDCNRSENVFNSKSNYLNAGYQPIGCYEQSDYNQPNIAGYGQEANACGNNQNFWQSIFGG